MLSYFLYMLGWLIVRLMLCIFDSLVVFEMFNFIFDVVWSNVCLFVVDNFVCYRLLILFVVVFFYSNVLDRVVFGFDVLVLIGWWSNVCVFRLYCLVSGVYVSSMLIVVLVFDGVGLLCSCMEINNVVCLRVGLL